MTNKPLNWIKNAAEPERTYRKMVIGWQNTATTLNTIIRAMNDELLISSKTQDDHRPMRELVLKRLIISSLFELRKQFNSWYDSLARKNLVSDETKIKKLQIRCILKPFSQFNKLRNAAFHFGDINDKVEDFLGYYEAVSLIDLGSLAKALEQTMELGYLLRQDASNHT